MCMLSQCINHHFSEFTEDPKKLGFKSILAHFTPLQMKEIINYKLLNFMFFESVFTCMMSFRVS